jgi:hypothetical protein
MVVAFLQRGGLVPALVQQSFPNPPPAQSRQAQKVPLPASAQTLPAERRMWRAGATVAHRSAGISHPKEESDIRNFDSS